MKLVTKKQIKEVLKSQNSTAIFKLCASLGIDVSNKGNVHRFIQENAHAQYIYNSAYRLSYGAADFKNFRADHTTLKMPISDALNFARRQKKEGKSNYSKVLTIGNNNIYWCSSYYGHSDYNKHKAFENTPKNRIIAKLINNYLNF